MKKLSWSLAVLLIVGLLTIPGAVAAGTEKVAIDIPIDPVYYPTVPQAPTNLQVGTDGSYLTHDLTWEDNSSTEERFYVERRHMDDEAFHAIAMMEENDTSYLDNNNLIVGDTYYYRVYAVNDIGNSDYSNIAVYVPSDTLDIPESVIPITPSNPELEIEPTPMLVEDNQVVIYLKIDDASYKVNGVRYTMDVAPIIIEGRTLLPIRYIADPLGAQLGWISEEQKATISFEDIFLELQIGENMAEVNGVTTPIDPSNDDVTPIILPPGRTMLPLRYIAETLGCQVLYNVVDRSIEVTYPAL